VAESINFSHKNVVVQEMMIIHPSSLKISSLHLLRDACGFFFNNKKLFFKGI
jgi:hypothetical protein